MTKREVSKIITTYKSVRFDLGCGNNKQEGFIGVDIRKCQAVDIVHDLEKFPWPIPSSCARSVVISHYWEHITPRNTLRFMAELHRICTPKANLFISGPYGMEFRYVQDPTHCNPTNEATFFYWDPSHPLYQVYRPNPFRVLSFEIFPVGMSRDFNAVLEVIK